MAGIGIILPLILLIFIVWGLKKNFLSKLNMTKKWIYLLLIAYVSILLIVTITSEVLKGQLEEQPKLISEKELATIEEALYDGKLETVEPSLIIEQRKHESGNSLSIEKSAGETYPNLFIERKNVNDGVIEETIFKPQLIVDGYDLSDQVKFTLPKWQDDEVLFLTPPLTRANFKSYEDAFLLGQFTSTPSKVFTFSHESSAREIAVYLRIPKDLKIQANEELYIEYVNE